MHVSSDKHVSQGLAVPCCARLGDIDTMLTTAVEVYRMVFLYVWSLSLEGARSQSRALPGRRDDSGDASGARGRRRGRLSHATSSVRRMPHKVKSERI